MNCLRNKNITTKVYKSSLIITLQEDTIQVDIYIPEGNEFRIGSWI